jgi:hypothetical protein
MIVTFYSYKGGVGRSMAMVNVGEVLADLGYRVVLCDWDLEAPGLERYLVDRPSEAEVYRERPGIMDLVLEYKEVLASRPSPSVVTEPAPATPPGSPNDSDFMQVGALRLRRPSSYAIHIPNPRRTSRGWIRFLSAGRRAGEWQQKYTEAVRDFDWAEFYRRWAGDAYFDFFRTEIESAESGADVVLIDSRTGVTEFGGVATHHLADAVVLLSAANDLNLEGTKWMVEALNNNALTRSRGARGPVAVFPIAARIEQTAQEQELLEFRRRFLSEFTRFLPDIFLQRQELCEQTEIPYIPIYSLREKIVARLAPDDRLRSLYQAYVHIGEALVLWGTNASRLRSPDQSSIPARVSEGGLASAARLLPKGRYYLAHGKARLLDPSALLSGLQSFGLDISSALEAAGGTSIPAALQIFRFTRDCAGGLLLFADGEAPEWIEAELNMAWAHAASNSGFRCVVLSESAGITEHLGQLGIPFPVIEVKSPFSPSLCAQVIAELLPEPILPSTSVLDHVWPDANAEGQVAARWCFGRDSELAELIARLIGPGGLNRPLLESSFSEM